MPSMPTLFKATVFLTGCCLCTASWGELPALATSPTVPPPLTAAPAINRATFTTTIASREPVDHITRISTGQTVYYFTELTGLQGHTITHTWSLNGAEQLKVSFPVNGARWRVQSSKTLNAGQAGNWTVVVTNDEGNILRQDNLTVEANNTISAPASVTAKPATVTPAKTPETVTTHTESTTLSTSSPDKPALSSPFNQLPNQSTDEGSSTSKSAAISTTDKGTTPSTSTDTSPSAKPATSAKPIWETLSN